MSYLKAVVGAVVAALTALQAALDNGGISAQEAIGAGIAALVAFSVVWAVPNAPETE